MAKQQYKPVTFLNSRGETISNDPVWKAQQTIQAAGADNGASDDDNLDKEPQLDADGNRTYGELDGKELKALAEERGVDISGLKKVGEVRQALIDADAANSDNSGE